MDKKELLGILDTFIEEKNASWNHDEWLSLMGNVKKKGFDIPENELGELLEGERDVFYAKKSGHFVIPVQKLSESCRNFIKMTNGQYSEEQKLNFINNLTQMGTFNKHELVRILDTEKKKYLEKKKQTTIDVEELDDLRTGISELQRKLFTKEGHISELNSMIDTLQAELIKKEELMKTHVEESKNKGVLLQTLKNDMQLERNFIDNTTRTLLEKEQSLNAKEAELKSKGLEVAEKLAELSKKLEYYQLIEKKSEIDSDKLTRITNDHSHQKNINALLVKKVSLLEKQLHAKIVELEKIKVVYREMHDTYGREKAMLDDAEKKLREFGREAMEKKVDAEKRQKWVLEREKPLRILEEKLSNQKKLLEQKEFELSKKENSLNEKTVEFSAREKEIAKKETKLIFSYRELDKKKDEIGLAKKEVDVRYGETGKSLREKQVSIDKIVKELREKTDTLEKEKQTNEQDKQELIEKNIRLREFYAELQRLKDKLDKREIDIGDKEKKMHDTMEKNAKTVEESQASLERYKSQLDKMKIEFEIREKELENKRKKVHEEMMHIENEKLKLEKKFLSMISNKD